jgi:Ca-activated chloride channel homolog
MQIQRWICSRRAASVSFRLSRTAIARLTLLSVVSVLALISCKSKQKTSASEGAAAAAAPANSLEFPSVPVMDAILKLFEQKKKGANVDLVLDTSGSMNGDRKIQNAREGAKQPVNLLSANDVLSLVPFSNSINWASTDVPVGAGKDNLIHTIDSLFASGGTALYDSIDSAYQHLLEKQSSHENRILSLVVTDGEDTGSKLKLDELMQRIRYDGETRSIHVFTIAYGKDARKDILSQIADATQAKSYTGTPQNIVDVFRDISTFF